MRVPIPIGLVRHSTTRGKQSVEAVSHSNPRIRIVPGAPNHQPGRMDLTKTYRINDGSCGIRPMGLVPMVTVPAIRRCLPHYRGLQCHRPPGDRVVRFASLTDPASRVSWRQSLVPLVRNGSVLDRVSGIRHPTDPAYTGCSPISLPRACATDRRRAHLYATRGS